MATEELQRQWARTESYLLGARERLPPPVSVACSSDLDQFDEFIQSNELGLAADWLSSIVREFGAEAIDAMPFLALAEASMGRLENVKSVDFLLSSLLGEAHRTVLPPDA